MNIDRYGRGLEAMHHIFSPQVRQVDLDLHLGWSSGRLAGGRMVPFKPLHNLLLLFLTYAMIEEVVELGR